MVQIATGDFIAIASGSFLIGMGMVFLIAKIFGLGFRKSEEKKEREFEPEKEALQSRVNELYALEQEARQQKLPRLAYAAAKIKGATPSAVADKIHKAAYFLGRYASLISYKPGRFHPIQRSGVEGLKGNYRQKALDYLASAHNSAESYLSPIASKIKSEMTDLITLRYRMKAERSLEAGKF